MMRGVVCAHMLRTMHANYLQTFELFFLFQVKVALYNGDEEKVHLIFKAKGATTYLNFYNLWNYICSNYTDVRAPLHYIG